MLSATERAALTDLVHRYAAGVDDRQFESVAGLFAEAAELMLPEPPATLDPVHRHTGQAAIRTAVEAVSATIRTEHAIVGEVFDAGPQPEVARGRIAPAQQRIKLARPLQGGKLIIAAHMGRTDENLGHGHASIRARHHLASALRIAAHVDLRELDALACQQPLGGMAIGAIAGRVNCDFGHDES